MSSAAVFRARATPLLVRDPEQRAEARLARRALTPGQDALWQHLRSKAFGVRFRRQAIVLGRIVDFWCPAKRLVVDVIQPGEAPPGEQWNELTRGHRVGYLRLAEQLVLTNPTLAVNTIRMAVE